MAIASELEEIDRITREALDAARKCGDQTKTLQAIARLESQIETKARIEGLFQDDRKNEES